MRERERLRSSWTRTKRRRITRKQSTDVKTRRKLMSHLKGFVEYQEENEVTEDFSERERRERERERERGKNNKNRVRFLLLLM